MEPHHLTWLDYVVLAGYFGVMILIGYIASLRIRHQEDFFMGGARLRQAPADGAPIFAPKAVKAGQPPPAD